MDQQLENWLCFWFDNLLQCLDGIRGNGTCFCKERFRGTACELCRDSNMFGHFCNQSESRLIFLLWIFVFAFLVCVFCLIKALNYSWYHESTFGFDFFFFFHVAISDSVQWLPYLGFVPGPTRTTSKGLMSLLFFLQVSVGHSVQVNVDWYEYI